VSLNHSFFSPLIVGRLHDVPDLLIRFWLLQRIVAALLSLAIIVASQLLIPGTAWAHPYLVRTLPQAGYAVADPPSEIGLVFDETVTFTEDAIVLDGQSRGIIATSSPVASRQSQKLTVTPDSPLPDGRYVVRWQVIGEDGHPVTGSFSFGVGTGPVDGADSSSTATPGVATGAVLRWSIFLGLGLALGGLMGDRLVRRRLARSTLTPPLERPHPWVRGGALAGLAGTVGLMIHQLGGGSILAGLRDFDAVSLWAAESGRMLVLEASGFALALLFGARHRPATLLALLIAIGAEAARSHLSVQRGVLGWSLVATHLVAAVVWVGALVHVSRAAFSWRGRSGESRALFVQYAGLALVLYVAVVATGTVAAVSVLPSVRALVESPYGRVLSAKLVLVAAVTVLALLARRRLANGRPRGGLGIRGLVSKERVSLVGVLLFTAVLSSMPTPPSGDEKSLTYPPPIRGDVIRLGALAGQVNVGVVTAQRHLEVHLEVPEFDPEVEQTYRLEGTVTSPSGVKDRIDFQSCGNGCFFATPSWQRGTNRLALTASAPGWHGGRAVIDVPWPVRDQSELLDRVLTTMAREPEIVVDEWVTSDTSRPMPSMPPESMSGKQLLRAEPYKSGKVGTVFDLEQSGENRWIAFGIRSQQVYVRLLVAPDGRLLKEEIVSPRHLIRHKFLYPTDR
jgi:copper transport protein